jgi:hypothetical protein
LKSAPCRDTRMFFCSFYLEGDGQGSGYSFFCYDKVYNLFFVFNRVVTEKKIAIIEPRGAAASRDGKPSLYVTLSELVNNVAEAPVVISDIDAIQPRQDPTKIGRVIARLLSGASGASTIEPVRIIIDMAPIRQALAWILKNSPRPDTDLDASILRTIQDEIEDIDLNGKTASIIEPIPDIADPETPTPDEQEMIVLHLDAVREAIIAGTVPIFTKTATKAGVKTAPVPVTYVTKDIWFRPVQNILRKDEVTNVNTPTHVAAATGIWAATYLVDMLFLYYRRLSNPENNLFSIQRTNPGLSEVYSRMEFNDALLQQFSRANMPTALAPWGVTRGKKGGPNWTATDLEIGARRRRKH